MSKWECCECCFEDMEPGSDCPDRGDHLTPCATHEDNLPLALSEIIEEVPV